ncbi:SH3 domain-containing protein [Roseibium sp. SCPC15]|uniref:SH3 domain-containing protein n=1 Tax=Roseibium sp. SCP15 TaxID=3141376 RepID=UPI0033387FEE
MYSVIAPAAGCDNQQGHRTDNANQENNKNELKLVSSFSAEASDTQGELQPLDPSEIAAKILQMHATADDAKSASAREPKLVDNQDETSFEMPGVLRRPRETDTYSTLQPDAVPAPENTSRRLDFTPSGLSLKIVVCSALLIAAAGGAGIVFAMPSLLSQEETAPVPVNTQSIATEPTIESIIASENVAAADSTTPSAAPVVTEQQAATAVDPATPQQIANAKDRIRNAFAAGKGSKSEQPVLTTQSVQSAGVTDQPVNALANQAQAKLERNGDPEIPASVDSSTGRLPVLASTSRTVPIPQSLMPAPLSSATVPQTSEDVPLTQETATAPQAPAAVASDPAYPNVATTSASVNLRQSDDKNAKIIGVIPESAEVQFSECGKWWCTVSYDGKTGFVGQKYLERTAQSE